MLSNHFHSPQQQPASGLSEQESLTISAGIAANWLVSELRKSSFVRVKSNAATGLSIDEGLAKLELELVKYFKSEWEKSPIWGAVLSIGYDRPPWLEQCAELAGMSLPMMSLPSNSGLTVLLDCVFIKQGRGQESVRIGVAEWLQSNQETSVTKSLFPAVDAIPTASLVEQLHIFSCEEKVSPIIHKFAGLLASHMPSEVTALGFYFTVVNLVQKVIEGESQEILDIGLSLKSADAVNDILNYIPILARQFLPDTFAQCIAEMSLLALVSTKK